MTPERAAKLIGREALKADLLGEDHVIVPREWADSLVCEEIDYDEAHSLPMTLACVMYAQDPK